LDHQRLGAEFVDQRPDRVVEQKSVFAVVAAPWERQVAGRTAGAILEPAGMRPAVGLVQADGEDMRVIGKGILHTVAVMGIEVEIDDSGEPLVTPGEQAEHAIVDIAEAMGAAGAAVMGAATGAMDHATGCGQRGGEQDAASGGGGAGEHLGIDRVVLGADGVAGAIGVGGALGCFAALQGGEIVAVVKAGELVDGGQRRGAIARLG
jgi:hypothetical protein